MKGGMGTEVQQRGWTEVQQRLDCCLTVPEAKDFVTALSLLKCLLPIVSTAQHFCRDGIFFPQKPTLQQFYLCRWSWGCTTDNSYSNGDLTCCNQKQERQPKEDCKTCALAFPALNTTSKQLITQATLAKRFFQVIDLHEDLTGSLDIILS